MAKTIQKSEFNIGDVVLLKSGGPDMTIIYIIGSNPAQDCDYFLTNHLKNDLVCRWFENNCKHETVFSPETILIKNLNLMV